MYGGSRSSRSRDPTMYVDGQRNPSGYSVAGASEMYANDQQYGNMQGIDEGDETNWYTQDLSYRSEGNAGGRTRDPTYYAEESSQMDTSFQTQEPSSFSVKSSRSGKSKKSKKSRQSAAGSRAGKRTKSWNQGASYPDVSDRDERESRQTKSFYN